MLTPEEVQTLQDLHRKLKGSYLQLSRLLERVEAGSALTVHQECDTSARRSSRSEPM
jgi:hypothetical protein